MSWGGVEIALFMASDITVLTTFARGTILERDRYPTADFRTAHKS